MGVTRILETIKLKHLIITTLHWT